MFFLVSVLPSSTSAQQREEQVDHAAAIAALPGEEQQRFGELLGKAQLNFEQGDFTSAVVQLTEAYAIYPFPRILFKLAEAHEKAGDLEAARANYQKYLESGDEAEDRTTILGLIANLDRRLSEPATLILDSTPSGARVFLDGEDTPVGSTPLRYPLTPGSHTLRLELDAHEPLEFALDAKYGAEMTQAKILTPIPVEEPDPEPDKDNPPPITDPVPPQMVPLARPVGVASALLGVGSGALFMLARSRAQTLDQTYADRNTIARPDNLETLTSQHNGMVIGAWSLAILSVAGTSFSLLRWKKERTQATISVQPAPTGGSLGLEVSF